MSDRLERFINFLRSAHQSRSRDALSRLGTSFGPSLTSSVMDDIFFLSLEDGWFGFTRTAFSFSAMACMAALVLFFVSGTVGHGTYVDRMFSGLLNDPAGLFSLYYMEF